MEEHIDNFFVNVAVMVAVAVTVTVSFCILPTISALLLMEISSSFHR